MSGESIDRGLYLVFPGPASYTGEDMVELSCHGGLLAPARLLAALHEAGARPAAPGEFTRRAVLNGKLDLVQAEAVGDLIDAGLIAQNAELFETYKGHQLEARVMDNGSSRVGDEVFDSLRKAAFAARTAVSGTKSAPGWMGILARTSRRGRSRRPAA